MTERTTKTTIHEPYPNSRPPASAPSPRAVLLSIALFSLTITVIIAWLALRGG